LSNFEVALAHILEDEDEGKDSFCGAKSSRKLQFWRNLNSEAPVPPGWWAPNLACKTSILVLELLAKFRLNHYILSPLVAQIPLQYRVISPHFTIWELLCIRFRRRLGPNLACSSVQPAWCILRYCSITELAPLLYEDTVPRQILLWSLYIVDRPCEAQNRRNTASPIRAKIGMRIREYP